MPSFTFSDSLVDTLGDGGDWVSPMNITEFESDKPLGSFENTNKAEHTDQLSGFQMVQNFFGDNDFACHKDFDFGDLVGLEASAASSENEQRPRSPFPEVVAPPVIENSSAMIAHTAPVRAETLPQKVERRGCPVCHRAVKAVGNSFSNHVGRCFIRKTGLRSSARKARKGRLSKANKQKAQRNIDNIRRVVGRLPVRERINLLESCARLASTATLRTSTPIASGAAADADNSLLSLLFVEPVPQPVVARSSSRSAAKRVKQEPRARQQPSRRAVTPPLVPQVATPGKVEMARMVTPREVIKAQSLASHQNKPVLEPLLITEKVPGFFDSEKAKELTLSPTSQTMFHNYRYNCTTPTLLPSVPRSASPSWAGEPDSKAHCCRTLDLGSRGSKPSKLHSSPPSSARPLPFSVTFDPLDLPDNVVV